MRIDHFDFDLPPERIALRPAAERDASRMLHVAPGKLADRMIRDLPDILKPGDLLVTNDTAVIPAQLFGARAAREAGAEAIAIDVTLHKDLGGGRWRAFVRPAKRVREGDIIEFNDAFAARVEARDGAEAVLRFEVRDGSFDDALGRAGVMPLPPYIARRRPADSADNETYQTVFAKQRGSVAAPTAGLHFTGNLLQALGANGVNTIAVTLHVGAGTFLPVTVDDTADHKMHSEWGEITEEQATQINQRRRDGGRIVAVGTTALRLLESAADEDGMVRPFRDETDIFITPGYRFRTASLLLTNFHLPRSTLFMLVCAFAGTEKMKSAYRHAIDHEYRFYSYGDACLLERET